MKKTGIRIPDFWNWIAELFKLLFTPKIYAPTNLKWEIISMSPVKVKFTWKKSVSADVVHQKLVLTVDGNESVALLEPDVEEHVVDLLQKKDYTVALYAYDGVHKSLPATLSFTTPDTEPPAAPTELNYEVVTTEEV